MLMTQKIEIAKGIMVDGGLLTRTVEQDANALKVCGHVALRSLDVFSVASLFLRKGFRIDSQQIKSGMCARIFDVIVLSHDDAVVKVIEFHETKSIFVKIIK
jgi:hypothetical protein